VCEYVTEWNVVPHGVRKLNKQALDCEICDYVVIASQALSNYQ